MKKKIHKISPKTDKLYVGGTLSMCGVHNRTWAWNRDKTWRKVDCEVCLKFKKKIGRK